MKDLRPARRKPMRSINDTVTEMVQWVFPEHAGAPGQIHGGRMMQWIATVGNMAAARVARGQCLLGAMDDIDFLHAVKVGEIAVLRAQVEAIGRCSIEVGVQVFAENLTSGQRTMTLNSHLVFVKVDEQLKPTPVPTAIAPKGADEEALVAAAQERRSPRPHTPPPPGPSALPGPGANGPALTRGFPARRAGAPPGTTLTETM